MNNKNGLNRWVILIILAAGCGLIYQLPYLRYSYYDSMITAFNVTNTQLGTLMTAYGLGSLVCYLIGGVLADKIASKYLLSLGQILTGAAGLYFATFPSYHMALVISLFWAFSTSLIFWPACINFIRTLGNDKEQGRLYGLFEGSRGIICTVIGLGIVAAFNAAATQLVGLRTVILIYAAINIFLGIVTYFVIPKNDKQDNDKKESSWANIGEVIKLPITWCVTVIIFCTMTCFICLGYTTPYLTAIMGASVGFAAAIGTVRTWGLQVVGGTSGGVIADKIGSSTRTIFFAFIVIAIGFVVLMFLPASSLWVATISLFLFGIAIYVNRGVYFATLNEAQVPMRLNGCVIGFASAIGFLPDAFMYTVIGSWLDKYPGAIGYKITFGCSVVSAIIGMIAAMVALKVIKNQQARTVANTTAE